MFAKVLQDGVEKQVRDRWWKKRESDKHKFAEMSKTNDGKTNNSEMQVPVTDSMMVLLHRWSEELRLSLRL